MSEESFLSYAIPTLMFGAVTGILGYWASYRRNAPKRIIPKSVLRDTQEYLVVESPSGRKVPFGVDIDGSFSRLRDISEQKISAGEYREREEFRMLEKSLTSDK